MWTLQLVKPAGESCRQFSARLHEILFSRDDILQPSPAHYRTTLAWRLTLCRAWCVCARVCVHTRSRGAHGLCGINPSHVPFTHLKRQPCLFLPRLRPGLWLGFSTLRIGWALTSYPSTHTWLAVPSFTSGSHQNCAVVSVEFLIFITRQETLE